MSDEKRRGQEPYFEGMELKHLSIEIEKGLNLNNLAQSLNQQISSPLTSTQDNTNTEGRQTEKE